MSGEGSSGVGDVGIGIGRSVTPGLVASVVAVEPEIKLVSFRFLSSSSETSHSAILNSLPLVKRLEKREVADISVAVWRSKSSSSR